jgi:hypothetical protein
MKFSRHKRIHDNYRFLQGRICKSFTTQPWWPTATVLQIPDVLGDGRSRGAGQNKEDDEGIRFYLLPVAERHRIGQI